MRGIFLLLLPVALVSVLAYESWAHGGGLNAAGCHNNRKTGGYHCHRSSGYTPRPATPAPNNARTICIELGFNIGTQRYEECVLLILRNAR
ncbi:MAG: YHYH domain-containing protein [Candidatus Puniceispirillaceae bacterium]